MLNPAFVLTFQILGIEGLDSPGSLEKHPLINAIEILISDVKVQNELCA